MRARAQEEAFFKQVNTLQYCENQISNVTCVIILDFRGCVPFA
jgi:hypothetical protein